MQYLRQRLKDSIIYSRYKRSDHPVISFDSDDWGTVKFANQAAIDSAQSAGFDCQGEPFTRGDCLESFDDFVELSKIICKYSDSFGNHPSMTLNFSLFNPDFVAIAKSGYSTFIHKPFFESYHEEERKKILEFLKNHKDIFQESIHGAQHVRAIRFVKDAKKGIGFAKEACDRGVTNFACSYTPNNIGGYMDELTVSSKEEKVFVINQLVEARTEFKKVFGEDCTFLTPSCGALPHCIQKSLASIGYNVIKTSFRYYIPSKDDLKMSVHLRARQDGIFVAIRNADMDPNVSGDLEEWKKSLVAVSNLFDYGIPVILSTHRLNYVAGISKKYRDTGLLELDSFLNSILLKYPNVEFLSSEELIKKYARM